MRQVLDIDFYYRALQYGLVGFVDEALVDFRLHSGQATNRNRKEAVRRRESGLLLQILLSRPVYPHLSWKVQLSLLMKHYRLLRPLGKVRKLIRRMASQ